MRRISTFLCLSFLALFAQGQVAHDTLPSRPKVGLVLGGGGAKGSAHIGVLKYLEENGIPVDYVVGTSMGSIMGGLYAMGYSADELEDLISNIDWSVYIKGIIDRRYQPSASRLRSEVLFKVPFGTGEFDETMARPLLGTLPSAFVSGTNLINLFNSLCVGYQDSMDFSQFPIPFACVATDISTGEEVVLRSGDFAHAIRASMAIPGVFSPVEIDGRLLVDGGLVNNFPVDICRKMGADIVIGVEVASDLERNLDNLQTLPQLMNQLMNIVVAKKKVENRKLCDVYIRPDVSGYNMLSFNKEAIDTIVNRGYRDAQRMQADLQAIKRRVGDASRELQAPRAVNVSNDTIRLYGVNISGVTDKERRWIMRKSRLEIGVPISGSQIVEVVSYLEGLGTYESVTYTLTKRRNKGDTIAMLDIKEEYDWYDLNLSLSPAKPHSVGVGFRYDSEESTTIFLDMGLNRNRLSGAKLDLQTRLGYNPRFHMQFTLAGMSLANLNLYYDFGSVTYRALYQDVSNFSLQYRNHTVGLYVSEFNLRNVSVAVGAENEFLIYDRYPSARWMDEERLDNSTFALYGKLLSDNLDDAYFARQGRCYALGFGVKTDATIKHWSHISYVSSCYADISFHSQWYFSPWNGPVTVTPQCYLRMLLGGYHVSQSNYAGNDYVGRYVSQQLPFVGLDDPLILEDGAMVLRCDLRWNVKGNHYISAIVNFLRSQELRHFVSNRPNPFDGCWGVALQYGIKSPIGPISVDLHWSDITNKVGVYFNLGYVF